MNSTVDTAGLLTIRDVKRIVRESRGWVIGITVATTLLFVAAALLMSPRYRAEVLLAQVVEQESGRGLGALTEQLSGFASLAGVDIADAGDDRATIIATLGSRAFALEFVEKHGLRPSLFADRWDPEAQSWQSPDDAPSDWEVVRRLDAIRTVAEDRATGLIVLSVEWIDRHEAAEWANQMVGDLNRHLRDAAIAEAEQSVRYLRRELEKTSIVELQQAIYRLIEVQINRVMLANVRDEYALEVIDHALVADEGDYATPSRLLIIVAGIILGLLLGVFFVIARHAYRNH